MQNLIDDLREFIELLNSHEVRYLIVGGFAVAFHGYPRMTGDIDFFIDSSIENARKVDEVLRDFGFGDLGVTVDDLARPDRIIQLGVPPNRIDLLTSISGATFEDAWDSRVAGELEGIPVAFVGRETLLANKAASGRPKDAADLDALQ